MSRLAERSRNLYESDAQRFAEWCRKRGEDPLPASETTIRSYVAHLREHGRAAATIKRALTAIRYTHRAHGLAFPDCPVVLAPPPRTRNSPGRARPLRLEELRRLVDSLPSNTPAGLRDRALFLLGFFSSARPRELLFLDVDHPIHAPDPWAPLPSQRGSRRNAPLVLSALPDMAELNPLIAVQEWKRQLAAQGIHEGPLFRRIDRPTDASSEETGFWQVGRPETAASACGGTTSSCAPAAPRPVSTSAACPPPRCVSPTRPDRPGKGVACTPLATVDQR